jgi:hypothetical protein
VVGQQQHPNRFLIGKKKMKILLNWFDPSLASGGESIFLKNQEYRGYQKNQITTEHCSKS